MLLKGRRIAWKFRGEIELPKMEYSKWKEFLEFVRNVSQRSVSMSRIVRMDYIAKGSLKKGGERNVATWSIDYRELGGEIFRLERREVSLTRRGILFPSSRKVIIVT